MTKLLTMTLVLWVVGFAPAPPQKFSFVDIGPHTNQKLKDNFSGSDRNNLAGLLDGGRTFEGVNFKIGDGVIQLASNLLPKQKPTKVEGIKVGQMCAKMHILHATEYGNGQTVGQPAKEGDPLFVADGTKIAEYKVVYDDGSTASIPVVYGEDVRDWWFTEKSKGVTRGKVAWKGDNELAKESASRIRVYLTSWENLHPGKKIASIDYLKIGDNPAAPFCVAITLEAK
jgi:hypothetical protein